MDTGLITDTLSHRHTARSQFSSFSLEGNVLSGEPHLLCRQELEHGDGLQCAGWSLLNRARLSGPPSQSSYSTEDGLGRMELQCQTIE